MRRKTVILSLLVPPGSLVCALASPQPAAVKEIAQLYEATQSPAR